MIAPHRAGIHDEGGDQTGAARRVVVTGIGCVTPIGSGPEGLWEGLRRRRSAVRKIDRFDPSPFRSHIAAQIDDFDPLDYMERSRARRLDRFAQLAVASSRMALQDAGLDPTELRGERVAVQMGSALGGMSFGEDQLLRFHRDGVKAVETMLALTVFCGSASCNVAIEFGFTGPNSTNAMSCASGAIAIGEAWRYVRDGSADLALAGGIEAPLAPLCYGAFAIIRAMSTRNDDPERASRPFDAERDGFVMGEGAAVLLLEERSHALARGARIYAELLGYGNTNDAHHMTAPRPDGREAARAMRLALTAAGVQPHQIDYVNAHASSTPLNDPTESHVIREVLGEQTDRAAVSGTKGYYGHALGASGAIEAAITALAIQRSWIPPTLNLESPDPACDLPHVTGEGQTREIRYAISNSFGFGGINASLVLGKS
ncbi:MAG TPA: beta-ketoacyl-ACP synthase II [Longimicrobiaceae bacterium]